MKINKKLLSFFENILGTSKKQNDGNFSFKCPWKEHKKSRLWVDFKSGSFQCFACQSLKGRSFFQLLKKINGTKYQFNKLKDLLDDDNSFYYEEIESSNNNNIGNLKLPDDFWPLCRKRKTIEYKNAVSYIRNKRNISWTKVKKYNIGYAENGKYSRRIIIPSYDKNGQLNYFVSRSYYDKTYLKYKNPNISRNIVPFELYISWNLPLIIVEGMFDAISVDYNCVPLLGKKVSNKLISQCVINDMDYVYLILDGDAINDYYFTIDRFNKNSIGVNPIFLNKNQDPSDLSNNEIFIKCKESEIVDEKTLLQLKMINRSKFNG